MKNNSINKEIRRVIVVLEICVLFVSLMVYLTYFQVFRAESVKMNSYNKRLWINEEKILRGSIIDRNGKILATAKRMEKPIRGSIIMEISTAI